MEWEDMPVRRRPVLLQRTEYVRFAQPTLTGEGQVVPDTVEKPRSVRMELWREASPPKSPTSGRVAWLREKKGGGRPQILFYGPETESGTIGHELGHVFNPKQWELSEFKREVDAWKWHFKNRLRSGKVDRDEVLGAASALATYLEVKSRLPHREAYKRSLLILDRAIGEARQELIREGEL